MKKLILLIALSVLFYSAPGYTAGSGADTKEEMAKKLGEKEPAAPVTVTVTEREVAAAYSNWEDWSERMHGLLYCQPPIAESLLNLVDKEYEDAKERWKQLKAQLEAQEDAQQAQKGKVSTREVGTQTQPEEQEAQKAAAVPAAPPREADPEAP